jgi:Xaa-Pro aminopeptidase
MTPRCRISLPLPFAFVLAFVSATPARAVDFQPLTAPREMFKAHREKFLAKLPAGSVAILRATPTKFMSQDTDYTYRPDSDFYWLTGIDEPDVVAVLRPNPADGKKYVLFLRPRDPVRESYAGTRAGPQEAPARYGADAAFPVDDFFGSIVRFEQWPVGFTGYLATAERLYLSDGGDAKWADRLRQSHAELRENEFGPATVVDAREIIRELRLVKDADEIALMRRAADISTKAHARAMAAAAPGKYEFEVQNALDSYCYANGVRRMAYPSIAASGPNSVYLHWDRNDRLIRDGDVILNDSGAEYGYYATDITRTYPASGKFTPDQRAIYDAVLAAQKAVIAMIKPGVTVEQVEKTSARMQTEALVRLGLLTGDVDKLLAEHAYLRFTKHGISHWVGMDVHDPSRYRVAGAPRPLAPGMVLTVEPGIYVSANMAGVDPRWWNIGVRIEDTILVTEQGAECLSCAAPKEVAEVEKAVGRK